MASEEIKSIRFRDMIDLPIAELTSQRRRVKPYSALSLCTTKSNRAGGQPRHQFPLEALSANLSIGVDRTVLTPTRRQDYRNLYEPCFNA